MITGPLSVLDALMVALSGFVIVFLMLAVLWGIVVVISSAAGKVSASTAAPAAAAPAPAPAAAPAPAPAPAAPQVVLTGLSDTEAACIMAIVSHETGIPLSELVFKSIKAM